MKRRNIIIASVVIILIVLGIVINDDKNVESKSNEKNSGEVSNYQIIVDVKGEVKVPGLYYLNSNSRLIDAINLAGGLTLNADTDRINLATKLEDGMIVNIFKKEVATINKISINKATIDELTKLPGIGEAKAKKIIEYRNKHGYFMSLEELKKIDNNEITEKIYNSIKELICL